MANLFDCFLQAAHFAALRTAAADGLAGRNEQMSADLVKQLARIVQLIGVEWGVPIGKHVSEQQTAAGRWPCHS